MLRFSIPPEIWSSWRAHPPLGATPDGKLHERLDCAKTGQSHRQMLRLVEIDGHCEPKYPAETPNDPQAEAKPRSLGRSRRRRSPPESIGQVRQVLTGQTRSGVTDLDRTRGAAALREPIDLDRRARI